MTSEAVKAYGLSAGASVVGVAAAESFGAAPEGYRPADALEGCRSVVVLGAAVPREAILKESTIGFIDIRNAVNAKISDAAKAVAKWLKKEGCKARAVTGMDGKYVDGFTRGTISLKHAAELAGLGAIGRNYLLINREYGTLLWFAAVLTDAELAPDEKAPPICDNCGICVEVCPSGALDAFPPLDKKACSGTMFKKVEGKWEIMCFQCRKMCPYWNGVPIVTDKKGNQLLEMIQGEEDEVLANEACRPLTGSLVVVKGPEGFMLLKNRFRNAWEIAGGMIEPGETPRQCAARECLEESGYAITDLRFVGLMKCFLVAGYFSKESRIEYTALYCADVQDIQAFEENEEMTGLRWYNPGEPIEDASEIDIHLLRYYI